jgi:transglutaminase-like putative cysteine protease
MKRLELGHRLASWLRAAVLAGAVALLCWPLTVASGVAAAVVGALLGALSADRLEKSDSLPELRLGTVLAAAAAVLLLGTAGARLLATVPAFAAAAGPVAVIYVSEAARWLFLVAPAVFALRFTASRRPAMEVLEVTAVAAAIVTGFAAHRDGMVHRPLEIGDWAWSRGIDPVLVFLAIGGVATLLLAALMVSEERRKRLPLHFSALILVAAALLLILRVGGLPKPQPAGDLGLTGDPESEAEDGDGEGEGSQEGRPQDQMGDLRFQDEYSSTGGQAPVAVVILHDDYSPSSGVYYFRQSAFSQYNGHRMVQAVGDTVDRDVLRRFPTTATEVPEAPPASSSRQPLRTSMGLLVDHVRPFALDSPVRIRPIRNPDPLRFQRAFEVVSEVQTLPYSALLGRRPGNADWTREQWDHYIEAPRDPRYAALADELMDWLQEDYRDDPLGQALAIKTYLDKEGIYSRRSDHAGADDPAASFLFGDLTGYCVHFAHAASYLMRSRGIPARVAAGYAVGEDSRGNSSAIMIRGGDAHAWPEIYLEDVGWVVVDLTPERSLDEPTSAADQDLQRMLGEMMRQQKWSEDEFEERPRITAGMVARWLAKLLLLLAAAGYTVKLYRWLAPRFAGSRALYRVAYRAALDRLAEVGWRRGFGESRESFAERAGGLSPSFVTLTERHLGAALGSSRRADAAALRRLSDAVRGEVHSRVPAWRWLAGTANPISWLRAR